MYVRYGEMDRERERENERHSPQTADKCVGSSKWGAHEVVFDGTEVWLALANR